MKAVSLLMVILSVVSALALLWQAWQYWVRYTSYSKEENDEQETDIDSDSWIDSLLPNEEEKESIEDGTSQIENGPKDQLEGQQGDPTKPEREKI